MADGVDRIVVEGLTRLPQFAHAGISEQLAFVSGTLGTTPDGVLAVGGVEPETTQALHNIGRILEAAGSTWNDVLKVSAYLADMGDFAAMNRAYAAFFPGLPPARITIGGVKLAMGARVEFECVALRRPAEPADTALPVRRTGFVEHEGERLYYEVVGEGGVPLVLSHGAGGNHAVWFQQVATFAKDRMVVTWDHRGYGRSSDLGGLSGPEVAARDLLAIMEHLGIAKADLVGQSMGGWSVVGAVLRRPGIARRVVLADTLGGFVSDAIVQALAQRGGGPLVAGDRLGLHPAIDPGLARRSPELAHLYQSLGRMGTADPEVMLPRLLAVTHQPAEASAFSMPVLCVVGDRDPLFPPRSIRALADLLPDARVVEIPRAGHSPYFEFPAAWNAAVGWFLDD
ncbi:MAG: alpha/beta fold hydrolase [Actinomycetota bacterium]|nr:alpha/beta fold hydrolase [Actinomycetota bacterium]